MKLMQIAGSESEAYEGTSMDTDYQITDPFSTRPIDNSVLARAPYQRFIQRPNARSKYKNSFHQRYRTCHFLLFLFHERKVNMQHISWKNNLE